MIPAADAKFKAQIKAIENLILSEVNIKEIEFLSDTGILVKNIKPNFKTLGPKFGKMMKQIASKVGEFTQDDINKIEAEGLYNLTIDGEAIELLISDVEIITEDIPGWVVANLGTLTVALDISITPQLKEEGIARELVNRIQNLRKENNFEVTDKINVKIENNIEIISAVNNNNSYICSETLADSLEMVDALNESNKVEIELSEDISTYILIEKV